MRSEQEIRRAFYLLGAVRELSALAQADSLPKGHEEIIKHAHALLAWVLQGSNASFGLFLDSLESQLAAHDLQIVEYEGGARILPLRENHRTKRASSRKR